jgi:hypothetical protein
MNTAETTNKGINNLKKMYDNLTYLEKTWRQSTEDSIEGFQDDYGSSSNYDSSSNYNSVGTPSNYNSVGTPSNYNYVTNSSNLSNYNSNTSNFLGNLLNFISNHYLDIKKN